MTLITEVPDSSIPNDFDTPVFTFLPISYESYDIYDPFYLFSLL